jgi:hypothetical protein
LTTLCHKAAYDAVYLSIIIVGVVVVIVVVEQNHHGFRLILLGCASAGDPTSDAFRMITGWP